LSPSAGGRRRNLALAAAAWAGACLGVFNLLAGVRYLEEYAYRNDFRLDFAAARLVLRSGWNHLYDYTAQGDMVGALGPGFIWQPFISPPPLAALALPLTALPFPVALGVWTGCLLAALGGAWFLAAPGGRFERTAHLALLAGFFPAVYGLAVGQPGALVALAVAAAWRLEGSGHPAWAGISLGAIALKPQLGILVPVALLFGGRWRLLTALLGVTLLIAAASLLAIGGPGLQAWLDGLKVAEAWTATRQFAASGLLGVGPQLTAFQLLVLALVAAVGWRQRWGDTGLLLAAGLAGSSLFTPYIGFQDFVVLVPAGWFVLRMRPPLWQVGLLLLGYLVLYSAVVLGTLPVVLWRLAWLVSLLALPMAAAAAPTRATGGSRLAAAPEES